jgi:hypothetical protein
VKSLLVVTLFLLSHLSHAQSQADELEFPNHDEIQLLLKQADRAFTQYEQAINQEAQAGSDEAEAVKKDRQVLDRARETIKKLQQYPDAFNTPAGYLLVGDLDDADRNMALCMGQIGMKSTLRATAGDVAEGHRFLRISQSCLDTSTLLFTVSETAFDMYGRYLLAEDALTKRATATLQRCIEIAKNCKKD